MTLSKPLEVPASVSAAAEVIAGLDGCFAVGFSRLGSEQSDALRSLQRTFTGSPLESAVSGVVDAIGRNEFLADHFAVLATARAALQGAQHDALVAHAREALGRPNPPVLPVTQHGATEGPLAVWQESARNWLMELALSGFSRLESSTLAPFTATLEQLQDTPQAIRLASVLTGFLNELMRSMPISAMPTIPLFRWCDLWTRSMIAALQPAVTDGGSKVKGTFSPLGVDLRGHGYFVSADIYGRLDVGKDIHLTKTTISAYKVDVVHGPEIWRCFDKSLLPIIEAISKPAALEISDCTLMPNGDLILDGVLKKGKPVELLDLAAKTLTANSTYPTIPPTDRHPIQIAEPVYLEEYTVKTNVLELGKVKLPLATKRMHPAAELKADHVKKADRLFGLLRFDAGEWSVQPLVVGQSGKKNSEIFTGSDAAANHTAKKGDTLAQLEERASRLLRQKA